MHVGSVPRFPASQSAAAAQGIGSKTYSSPCSFCFRYGPGAPACSTCPARRTPVTETSGARIAGPGGIKQVEIAFDRLPQVVLRVAAGATVLAPPAMIPVLVADLAQVSQRRAQVFAELQPLIGRLWDQPLQRPEVSRFQRRERPLVGTVIDRPDAHRAADVVIPDRVQVRPPEIHEAALAEPQLIRQPVGPFGAGLPRNFLRGQVDRDRDLNGSQRIGSVQYLAEGIHGFQERLRIEPEGLHALTRLGEDPQLLDGALVSHDCISCTSLLAPRSAG